MRFLTVIMLALGLAIAAVAQEKGTVVGRVESTRGKAIAGVLVRAVDAGGDEAITATTDEKGVYRLELAPGVYRLEFEASGYASASLRDPVRAEAGREVKVKHKVELPEADQGSLVRGSVFMEDGRSLPFAEVWLERVPTEASPKVPAFRLKTVSDRMGLFAFAVPKGEYRYEITASREGYETKSTMVDVFGGETVNVALKLPAKQ